MLFKHPLASRKGTRFDRPQWRIKSESWFILCVMGSERASSVRQRYAGKVCCECGRSLPPPHRRGERLCRECAGVGQKRVFLRFKYVEGWFCEFLDEDQKTALPRTVMLRDERKLFEMLRRAGFTLNISGRQEIEAAIRKKTGGAWLDLTREQYAKLLRHK